MLFRQADPFAENLQSRIAPKRRQFRIIKEHAYPLGAQGRHSIKSF